MIESKTINNADLQKTGFDNLYFDCKFIACDLSEMELSNTQFEECSFQLCNLSMTKLLCQMNDVKFMECKIVGADFSTVNKNSTSLKFDKCNISYTTFIGTNLHDCLYSECHIVECDFTDANLSRAVFDNCELAGSIFSGTNLEKADFETSRNYIINPTANRINKMVVSESELKGLVAHLNIVIK